MFFFISLINLSGLVTSDLPAPVCPPGSSPSSHDPNFCYFVVKESNTFKNAEFTCQANNPAHLPKIKNAFANYYIGELARSNDFDSIWIGATNILTSKGETYVNWYWENGNELLSFTNWAPSEPSSGNCAMLSVKDGYLWHSRNCSDFLPTICQRPAVYSICDQDWKLFGKTQMCYKTFINPLSFDNAEAYCKTRGGHLASIHSEEENEFVIEISKSGIILGMFNWTLSPVRIGLYHLSTDPVGTWHWTDGTAVDYSKWDHWGGSYATTGPAYASLFSDSLGDPIYYKNWNPNYAKDLPVTRGFVCKKPPNKIQ